MSKLNELIDVIGNYSEKLTNDRRYEIARELESIAKVEREEVKQECINAMEIEREKQYQNMKKINSNYDSAKEQYGWLCAIQAIRNIE